MKEKKPSSYHEVQTEMTIAADRIGKSISPQTTPLRRAAQQIVAVVRLGAVC